MLTPRTWTRALHRSPSVLAALLAILACSKDGDHYSPLPNNPSPQATVVAGAVRDGSDHVVADALVVIEPVRDGITATIQQQVENPGAANASAPGRRVTVTGDNGSFAFDDVDAGEYFLQVIADDHLGAMRSLSVPDPKALIDTVFVDVDLTPTGTFTGVATLENATEHQGTVVYAQGTSYVAVTDPTGAYALTDVPVGSYTVRAEHAHYLEDTENGTITTAGEIVPLAAMLLRIDSNIPPVATIASASPEVQNVPVQFVASGSDADGSVVLYEWDWEDDGIFDYSNASTANTSHTYSAEGDFTAKLRVTDDDGAIGLAVVTLSISANVAPTATIVSASPQQDGTPVLFVANGTDGDGTVVLYEWDWEDNGSYDSSSGSSGNASHLYLPGNYTARFRVTDDAGATDEDTIALVIVRAQIFMSTSGSDINPGTAGSPVLTLPVAYSRAQANSIDEVYILEGSYPGAPTFVSGIDVRGGRQLPYWTEGTSYSAFNFTGSARGTANNITTDTTIRKLTLTLSSPSAGANAIALYSLGSSLSLRFEDCQFTAPNASNGANGTAGTQGANGLAGLGGAGGSCDGAIVAPGGAGGPSPSGCPGGSGGNGGPAGVNNGSAGAIGGCGGGSGGSGGPGGDPGGTGQNGAVGANGTLGNAGLAASPSGAVVANEWVPGASTAGGTGTSGRGGGGGGGGGAQGGTFVDDGTGNGGGGGGGGGAGGTGGTAGTGGRASFAVMLVNSHPQFASCRFQTGTGGSGGNGGLGAGGGNGGASGPGANVCTGEVGAGGNGGLGGNGGSGGGGAGGPGGPSYGVYKAGTSVPSISGAIFVIGGGGTGGAGAPPNGQNASGGLSGNTN